jgi:hypothetical protein
LLLEMKLKGKQRISYKKGKRKTKNDTGQKVELAVN